MPAPPESSRGAARPASGEPAATSRGNGTGSSTAPAQPATKPNPRKTSDPPGAGTNAGAQPGCWAFITVNPEKSTLRKGTAVHGAIRDQISDLLAARYGRRVPVHMPDASAAPFKDKNRITGGGKREGEGDVDLAFCNAPAKTMMLAELKPANLRGLTDGEPQLQNYIDKGNANEDLKKRLQVTEFVRMDPDPRTLPRPAWWMGRAFELQWCVAGIVLYKEIKNDEDEEKQKEQRAEKRARAQNELTPQQRALEQSLHFKPWTPEALKNDIVRGLLEDGLYLNRYQLAWPSGEVTNVVVWVKTGAGARDFQYYQQYPESAGFFERFAARRGLSPRQADLIRRVMIEYNRDLLKFVVDRNGRLTGIGPWAARDLVRQMYIDRLRLVVSESARDLVTAGAAQEVAKTVQGVVGIARSIQGARSTPVREAPQVPVQEAPAIPAQEPDVPLSKPPKTTLRDPLLSIPEAPAAPVRDAPAAPVRQAPVDPNVGGEIFDGLGRSLEQRL